MATSDPSLGASNDTAEELLRKHLNPALKGRAWDALLGALAVGDRLNWDMAKAAFDQLFKSTASGVYLDRKCGDDGVARPPNIGMPDDLYRRLGIKVTAGKLTQEVLLEVLEIFYGSDSLRAHVETEAEEPYALVDGEGLQVLVDERETLPVTFQGTDFSVIGQASALEVATAMTRQFRLNRSKAFAVAVQNAVTGRARVRVYSGALGLGSSVRVPQGLSQKALRFEAQVAAVDPATSPASLSWVLTSPEAGLLRMKLTGAVALDLTQVQAGDYVLVTGANFDPANRGSHTIQAVDVRYNGATLEQYIELEHEGVAQAGVAQVRLDDVLFFRPTKKSIHAGGSRTVVVAQSTPEQVSVVLPATTQAVERVLETAAYPMDPAEAEELVGPYLVDPDGVALTSIETVSTQDLYAGRQYATLQVVDASSFPDEEGWLVIGFGQDSAAYPIRYLGRLSGTALMLDYQQRMPHTNLSGATVTLLADKSGFEPAADLGLFYLTASSAGRIAATQQLQQAVAAGVELDLTVVYPGDRGLGGEGLGASGRKVSDKVAIWGGDDLDAEMALARGKS